MATLAEEPVKGVLRGPIACEDDCDAQPPLAPSFVARVGDLAFLGASPAAARSRSR